MLVYVNFSVEMSLVTYLVDVNSIALATELFHFINE